MSANAIEQFQQDLVARIGTSSYFADIVLIEERKGTTQDEVNKATKELGDGAQKLPGVSIIVLQPSRVPDGGQSNLHWLFTAKIQVAEMPIINRQTGGNGKWHSDVSLALEDLLHQWVIGGRSVLVKSSTPINDGQGVIGTELTLTWETGQLRSAFCRAPNISGTSAAVTLATSEAGAALYYTQDGSLPTAAAGTLYSAPFTTTAGTLIRAVAVLAGKNDSDCEQQTIAT